MKPSVARIPSKYAYKREGRDIDDGMDRYEESESTIARDVQRAWESGVAVDDFIVPLGDHISPIEPKGVPALQSPENTHRAACSAVPARRLPPEIRSIILKLHEILSTLSHPWTASEIQNYVQQLQLSVYGIYWLLLFTENGLAEGPMDASSDAIWQDHPVVEHLNTLLSRRSKTGRHASEPEGPESPLTEEKQPPYALSTDLVTETVSSTKPEIERIAVSTRMLQNRGLTKARPKDRKNPRVNQRRKFQRGVRKVKSLGVKSFLPEDRDGFKGVSSIKPHVIRTTRLS